jgi:hypothetical protein
MKRPISSRVSVMFAMALYDAKLVPAARAHSVAMEVIEDMRSHGFDIVHADWVNGAIADPGKISWDEIATMADKIENDMGRRPWLPES